MANSKMGIMDKFLSRHLKAVTKEYIHCSKRVEELCEVLRNEVLKYPTLDSVNNNEMASALRNDGNIFFKKQLFKQAHMLYTRSIAAAVQDSQLTALAFANRSAALFNMQKYEDCLRDISRADGLGYPGNLKYKLYIREARCLKYLGRDFGESVEKAEQMIRKFNKGMENVVSQELGLPEPKLVVELPSSTDWTLPSLSYGANKDWPSLSSAVSVAESNVLGRHFIADRDIETGDVLVVEESLVAAVAPESCLIYCYKCFKFCLSLIPCKVCGSVMYCSDECRVLDWEGSHEDSCYYTQCYYDSSFEEDSTDIMVLPEGTIKLTAPTNCCQKRLLAHFGVEDLKDVIINNKSISMSKVDSEGKKLTRNEQFRANLEAFLSLEDNYERLETEERRTYAMEAFTVTGSYLIDKKERPPMAAFIMKLNLILAKNLKPVIAQVTNYQLRAPHRVQIGYALYLSSSLINHSCYPNMERICYGNTAVYRAKRPIKKGEQLTECYEEMSVLTKIYADRQGYCKQIHKFTCRCEGCKENWPLLKKMPTTSEKDEAVYKMLVDSGFDPKNSSDELKKLKYLLKNRVPPYPEIFPKMVLLLKEFHKKGMKMNQWYFQLQESIQNYFKVQGSTIHLKNGNDARMGVVNPC